MGKNLSIVYKGLLAVSIFKVAIFFQQPEENFQEKKFQHLANLSMRSVQILDLEILWENGVD